MIDSFEIVVVVANSTIVGAFFMGRRRCHQICHIICLFSKFFTYFLNLFSLILTFILTISKIYLWICFSLFHIENVHLRGHLYVNRARRNH